MPGVYIKVVRAELGPDAKVKSSYVAVTFRGKLRLIFRWIGG